MTPNLNLTKRERETLALLAQGLTMAEAADAMGVSFKTVSTHSYRLYSKIGVHDRTRLAHYALHHGIVENVFAEGSSSKFTDSSAAAGASTPLLTISRFTIFLP